MDNRQTADLVAAAVQCEARLWQITETLERIAYSLEGSLARIAAACERAND